MSDSAPPEPPEPQKPPEPQTERYPFWGYYDLFVFVGLFVASLIVSAAAVSRILKLFRIGPGADLLPMLVTQMAAYVLFFLGVSLVFRTRYGRAFWSSLAW